MPDFSDATLTINLSAIAGNYRTLQQQLNTPSACAAVIKANAYGLGVMPVAHTLYAAGCRHFFVANLNEGIELRSILPDAVIYLFHGVSAGRESAIQDHRLIPVLNNLYQVDLWQHAAERANKKLPAILHLDTGMSRLGLSEQDTAAFLENPPAAIEFHYLMSHLACAHDPEHFMNTRQLHQFRQIAESMKGIKRSFANSSGIFLGKEYHFNLVRPGAALYGINPLKDAPNPMRHVVTIKTRVLQLHTTVKQETVGYGATIEVPRGARIATLAIGYADGYFRTLGNKSFCSIAGHTVPIIGRVSMDLVTADVTAVPDQHIYPGAEVEMVGEHYTVDKMAEDAGTIAYEALTNLGRRYRRVYQKEEVVA